MSNTIVQEGESPKGYRIQLDFSAGANERLDKLKSKTDATSYAEVVRNALRVYEWFVEQEKQGMSLGLVKDGKLIKEVHFVF